MTCVEQSMEWEGHGNLWLRIVGLGVVGCGRFGGMYAVGAVGQEGP